MQTSSNLPLALTAEQIKSPGARAALVSELVGNPFDRGEAEAFVELLRRSAAGEDIRPDEQAFFAAQRAMLESRAHLEEMRAASIEKTARLESLKNAVEVATSRLATERDLARTIALCLTDESRLNYWTNRRGVCGPMWSADAAVDAGSKYAGARETLALLEDVIVPAAEMSLAQARADLADFEAANSTAREVAA